MKKLTKVISVVLVLCMLFSLAACGKKNEQPAEDKHLNVAIYWNAHVDTMSSWGGWWTMRYGIGETLLTMDAN